MYNSFKNYTFIAIGAIPAALIRWQIDEIYIVNIIGCFILGFINRLNISRRYKLVFGFGFCGSLTTFSGWSFQLFQLLNKGLFKLFFLNSILTILISLVAIGMGHFVSKKINP